jgi:hypothetical protein
MLKAARSKRKSTSPLRMARGGIDTIVRDDGREAVSINGFRRLA